MLNNSKFVPFFIVLLAVIVSFSLPFASAAPTATYGLNALTLQPNTRVDLDDSFLNMQTDGNVVLYEKPATPLWQSHTFGGVGSWAKFQSDGNFVIYNAASQPLWYSSTHNIGVTKMVISDDRFTFDDAYGPLWDSVDSSGSMVSSYSSIPMIDPYFENVNQITYINNDDLELGAYTIYDWRVKTTVGAINATVTKVSDGIEIDADYGPGVGYLYLRQIIEDVYQFEGKTIKMVVNYTNDNSQNVYADMYILARFNVNDSTRILVADTPSFRLYNGTNTIAKTFTVPSFNGVPAGDTEGLSAAFRIIGDNNENITLKVHSIRLIVTNP